MSERDARKAFEAFRQYVHEHTPDEYKYDMRHQWRRERGICGEHGRRPSVNGTCPKCAGYVEDVTGNNG